MSNHEGYRGHSPQVGKFPARILRTREVPESSRLAEMPEDVTPFVFSAEISSDRLDAYFTHMHESTLRNFAGDATAGVSFLDSHDSYKLGFGQSLRGEFEKGDVNRVLADFYTVPGVRFGGKHSYESTDDFIRAVTTGLVRDVSVGFYGGDIICDICGNSLYDWANCPHWPGEEYAVGDQGKETVVATFQITDAHLAEVSAVYDGATPGAMIMRATEMAEAGKLSPEMTRRLEVKYRIKLPGAARSWPGVDTKAKGKEIMTEPIKTESNEPLAEVRAVLIEAKAPEGTEVEGVRWLATELQGAQTEVTRLTAEVQRLQPMESEVQRLQPLADDGKQYRSDLITETLAEGVRAMGDTFPEETYKGMLEPASIEAIKKMRDAFAEQAKGRLPNGRQTVDDDQLQNTPRPAPATPDLAYAG